jgi:hypothetical protein
MPRQSNKVSLTKQQKEVLLGILLGDGHIELALNGKSARLKIEQELKKMEYVSHLHQLFSNLSPGEITAATNSNNVRFSTRYSSTLLFYHTAFYGTKRPWFRKVPCWIEGSFTARSLAYLIMDDGGTKSKDSKGLYINVYGLKRRDQEFLCNILVRKFSLQAKTVKDRKYSRIFISGHSYETLMPLIDPYILPCVRYKIPSPRKR